MMNRGYWMANFSLLVFWLALISAGIIKSKWQMSTPQIPFSTMMLHLRPYLVTFVIAGAFLMSGILMIIYPLVTNQLACYFKPIGKKFRVHRSKLAIQNA
jgi:nitric oxide reductase subunit B